MFSNSPKCCHYDQYFYDKIVRKAESFFNFIRRRFTKFCPYHLQELIFNTDKLFMFNQSKYILVKSPFMLINTM